MTSSGSDLYHAICNFDVAHWAATHGAECLNEDEYILTCPKCLKKKLAINVEKRSWHCFVCETWGLADVNTRQGRGGLLDLMHLVEGKSKAEIAHALMQQMESKPLPDRLPTFKTKTVKPMSWALPIAWPPMVYALCQVTYPQYPYLQRRKISLNHALAYRLAVGTVGRYANRLFFPCFEHGQMVYYQARAMYDAEPNERFVKALNTPRTLNGTTASEVLFNFDQATQYRRIAICEGPIDALRVGPDAVATFGKHVTPTQIAKLRSAGVTAVDLIWDGPGPTEPQGAWPDMLRVAPSLATFFELRLVRLPSGDPGDQTTESLAQMRAQARVWVKNSASIHK